MSPLRVGGRRGAWALYLVCGVLIAASAAVIAWRLRPGEKGGDEPRVAAEPEAVRDLLARVFHTDTGTALRLDQVKADYLVLYLFTPLDCAACLPELAALDEFAAQRPEFRVVAIMGYSNRDEARQTRDNFDLDIPILQDPQGEAMRALAPPKTPWKIVLAMPEGGVVLQELGARDTFGAEAFLRRLRRLAAS